jgi:hypothetical protein
VLFLVGQATPAERGPILEAIFDLPRAEVAKRVQSGAFPKSALAGHDYALDETA